jgi:hypothetical protein
MGLLSKPGGTVAGVLLPCDAALPDDKRIRWTARVLTVAERVEVRDALYAADRLTDQVERDKAITDVLKRCADGWDAVGDDGQPVPFDDAGLAQLLPEVKFIIAGQLPEAAGWAVASKKG